MNRKKEIWQIEFAARVTSPEMLPPEISLSEEERRYCTSLSQTGTLPFCISPLFLSLVAAEAAGDNATGNMLPPGKTAPATGTTPLAAGDSATGNSATGDTVTGNALLPDRNAPATGTTPLAAGDNAAGNNATGITPPATGDNATGNALLSDRNAPATGSAPLTAGDSAAGNMLPPGTNAPATGITPLSAGDNVAGNALPPGKTAPATGTTPLAAGDNATGNALLPDRNAPAPGTTPLAAGNNATGNMLPPGKTAPATGTTPLAAGDNVTGGSVTGNNATGSTPLRAQVIPSPAEAVVRDVELADPLGEHHYQAAERLVHQYRNRALLLSTGICFSYCRHCFRRTFTGKRAGFITAGQLDEVCRYLAVHDEIDEILISGGDPLTADDRTLEHLFVRLRAARPDVLLRICTRAPVFMPSRFTPQLLALLRRFRPLWLIPHINHPAELSPPVTAALQSCLDHGIPIQSQTVLLRTVNDTADILAALFTALVKIGVKPGYLFQGDLAPGTGHLRVPVDTGIALYRELEQRLSGLSLPVYAVDLPGGGGKMPLGGHCPDSVSDEYLAYVSKSGGLYRYPREH